MKTDLQIALLRGINVGRAKRVAMADLRKLMGDLGYTDVRTVLNSGNVVFCNALHSPAEAVTQIEDALVLKLGVAARATVLDATQFATIVEENCLCEVADDHARLLVSILNDPSAMALLKPLLKQDWAPEALAAGRHAVYLWCPSGVLASRAAAAVGAILGDGVTSRNWSTVNKLYALVCAQPVPG